MPKLRKEDEPCGSCFRAWCPDSCKDEQCGECEKGFECKQVSALREPPRRCKKITGNHIVFDMLRVTCYSKNIFDNQLKNM